MQIKQEPGYVKAEPGIKQEPGLPNTSTPPIHPGYSAANTARGTAAQRAAQALESQYGQRAAASIHAIHSGMTSQMHAGAQSQQGPRPGQVPQHLNPQQQYRQGVSASMQQRLQQTSQAGSPNGLPSAQVDGSGDVAKDGNAGPPVGMDRAEIDRHLHAQLLARAKQMEGGGLMLPLRAATAQRSGSDKPRDGDGPGQFDGPGDDVKSEESDEDAINSDLDDPDEDREDEDDEDDSMNQMMLCMYDKVQRVKNKWYVSLFILGPDRVADPVALQEVHP